MTPLEKALALGQLGVWLSVLLTTLEIRALKRRLDVQPVRVCTRPEPHICRVNGPCNGWPR